MLRAIPEPLNLVNAELLQQSSLGESLIAVEGHEFEHFFVKYFFILGADSSQKVGWERLVHEFSEEVSNVLVRRIIFVEELLVNFASLRRVQSHFLELNLSCLPVKG